MQPCSWSVYYVYVTSVVDVDIVRLRHDRAVCRWHRSLPAALLGHLGYRWNVVSDLTRIVRVANIDGPHPGVLVRDEKNAVVEDRSEILIRPVRAKCSA